MWYFIFCYTMDNHTRFCCLRRRYYNLDTLEFRAIFTDVHDFLNCDNYSKSFTNCASQFHILKCSFCGLIECSCQTDVIREYTPSFECLLCNYEISRDENLSE